MDLPTEEDVLAFLVLNKALGELCIEDAFSGEEVDAIHQAIANWRLKEWPKSVEMLAHQRLLAHDRIHAAAIADSERRLAVEQARDAVVRAARIWDGDGGPSNLNACLRELSRAEAEAPRHGR